MVKGVVKYCRTKTHDSFAMRIVLQARIVMLLVCGNRDSGFLFVHLWTSELVIWDLEIGFLVKTLYL